jgi:hypothetical protein
LGEEPVVLNGIVQVPQESGEALAEPRPETPTLEGPGEGRRRKAEGGKQKAESRRQKAEGRRRKAEGGKQKAEGGKQKAESRGRALYYILFVVNPGHRYPGSGRGNDRAVRLIFFNFSSCI